MPETQSTFVDDEAAEHIAHWKGLPHPLEAAVLHEVNEPDPAVTRASELLHRNPTGVDGPTRSVWILARMTPSGEGERQKVASWCWYATRQAAETARRGMDGTIVLHETRVPRTVRVDGVEEFLAGQFRAPSAQPAA